MRIYWIENGKRCGPATVPDILSKVQLGELAPDVLGWHSGCADWVPLKELPALADFLSPAEPVSAAEESPAEPEPPASPSGAPAGSAGGASGVPPLSLLMPGPVTRFLARMVDMVLYATIVLSIMHLLQIPYMSSFHPGRFLFWVPMLVIEAMVVCAWGTTPGKYWMGVRLQGVGGRISFRASLMRCIFAFALGLGCMVPLLNLFTLVMSFAQLRRRGFLPWDALTSTVPILTRPSSFFNRFVVLIYIFFCLSLCGQYMQPWLPDMQAELRRESPEVLDYIHKLLPPR